MAFRGEHDFKLHDLVPALQDAPMPLLHVLIALNGLCSSLNLANIFFII
jgi:hypothetical protein